MKSILLILASVLLLSAASVNGQAPGNSLFDKCRSMAGSNAVYLKDFIVRFPAAQSNQTPPVSRNSVILSKNIRYRFSVCNSDKYDGVAVIQLFDEDKLLLSNLIRQSDKIYPYFDFVCNRTGRYYVMISFKDGKAGEAVGIMSYIKQ